MKVLPDWHGGVLLNKRRRICAAICTKNRRVAAYHHVGHLTRSSVLHLPVVCAGTVSLFPLHSRNSFCYVALDPLRRLAKVWYHAFIPFW